VPTADLVSELSGPWQAVTRHPFLDGVRDGTLPAAAFDTWLAQDAHFVSDLLGFQARLLARAPRPAQAVLAGGAVALVDELAWFDRQAAERGLPAGATRLPATEGYAALLARLDALEPGTALTALWVVERSYLDAWSWAAPGAPEYRGFVAHWTTPGFATYVAELERAADGVGGDPDPGTVAVVADVLSAEVAFWDMAVAAA
jgi:thiaminase/transcriptional activator TenA